MVSALDQSPCICGNLKLFKQQLIDKGKNNGNQSTCKWMNKKIAYSLTHIRIKMVLVGLTFWKISFTIPD